MPTLTPAARERTAVPPRHVVRILAVWAVVLSVENVMACVRRPADGYVASDWFKGQLLGVPFALALLVPASVLLVLIARQAAARRAYLVGAVGALVSMGVAIPLTTGPTVAALERRIPFVAGAGCVAFALAFVFVRRAPLDRHRLLAALGTGIALAAWFADQRVLPGLYPALHLSFVALALVGTAALSLLLPQRVRAPSRKLTWAIAGMVGGIWATTSCVLLGRDDAVRHGLLGDAPVLGRLVFAAGPLASQKENDSDVATAARRDPAVAKLIEARERPRVLDWSACDVLLVTVDALRADHLGAYGYGRATSPELDKLAARGARFEHAYASAPNTSYSTASLLAGRNMRPIVGTRAGKDIELWPEYMKALGYNTMAFYPPAVFNVDAHRFRELHAKALGFEHHSERFANAEELARDLASYLENAPKNKRLFVWAHVFEPHEPYELHSAHPFHGGGAIDAYDSEIAAADEFIGKAVALVEARSTCSVIFVTADHGEAFGEHGATYHGTNVHEEQVRVPLIVVGPGVVPGVIERPVQTIDLLPTTLAALGQPRPRGVTGRDLSHRLAGQARGEHPGLAFAETARYTMVAAGTERVICDRDAKSCTLYDLATDPKQEVPVRDRPDRLRFLRKVTAALGAAEAKAATFPLRIAATGLEFRRGNVTVESDKLVATGEQGTLIYGPYIKLPAGAYEARWKGSVLDSSGQIIFSVRADAGREILAYGAIEARDIPAQGLDTLSQSFALDRDRYEVEFVVESSAGGRVALEQLVVDKTGTGRFPLHFSALGLQLKHANARVDRDTVVATGDPGAVIYGPYIELPAGSYELTWEGKGMESDGQIGFSVRAQAGQEILVNRVVKARTLPRSRTVLTRLQFVLDRPRSGIEFVVESGGGGLVALRQLVLSNKRSAP